MVQAPAPAHGFTVSADLISGIIECAAQCGVPRARFADLIQGGGSGATTSPASARYSGELIFKLWDRIVRQSGDPIVSFRMALVASAKTFGVLGHILPRCATVLDAYRQTERYAALASQGAHVSVVLNGEALIVSLAMPQLPPGDVSRSIWLWGLTNLALLPKRLAGAEDKPKEILCTALAPRPTDLRVLRDQFPFKFGASESRVVFDRRVGELAISTADADLRSLLAETMDRHLVTLGPAASFEEAVLTVLRSMMNGNMPTVASLSRCSGMSQRTLQRRLSESHTSFQRLLRQVLHETSDELLARETLSHGEIAFLLGYSEESAFSRAYKSWTGHPPGSAHLRRTVQHYL